jgi:hypothetical protein
VTKRSFLPCLACLFAALGSTPAPAHPQTGAGARILTPEESEAHQMSLELAFACSPRRHNQVAGSESTIRREGGALSGTAVHFRSVDGAYLVLEEYDEALAGHCLVIGWFGGELRTGRYDIGRLAMSTVEAEIASGNHSFFSMSAVRAPSENSILVVESGTVDIAVGESGRITGTFELRGFLVDGGSSRWTGDAAWAGSFSALEGEG